ncbi:MAG: hypothetical protein J5905_05415 [Prevotella sp.]|nr:hypothetical protein [Prevotella sp.]
MAATIPWEYSLRLNPCCYGIEIELSGTVAKVGMTGLNPYCYGIEIELVKTVFAGYITRS